MFQMGDLIIILMLVYILLIHVVQVLSFADWKPEELDELSYYTQSDLDFKPQEQEIMIRYGPNYERKIFSEPLDLLESEIEQISNFHNFLSETSQKLPERFVNDYTRYELRYLTASQFDFQKAYDRLVMRDKWLTETFPMPKELGFENPLLKSSLTYWFGRDFKSRPVAVVTLRHFISSKELIDAPISDVMNSLNYIIQYGVEQFMAPGQVESYLIIYDFGGIQPW